MTTTREKIEVMEASERGHPIEFRSRSGHAPYTWCNVGLPQWNWVEYSYRVSPLDPDSIDWSHVSSEYKWMARDKNGEVYLYTHKPQCDEAAECWINGISFQWGNIFTSYKRGSVDWKDSLVERI